MGDGSEQRPGSPGYSGAPVQRAVAEDSVPEAWLAEPVVRGLGEAFDRDFDRDRLGADNDLIQSLALAGFEGRDWDYFATELARYGMAVVASWMRRGLILGRCRKHGFGGLPELGRDFTEDEISELTNETVAKALDRFRCDVLMKKKWDYRKGATIRTFFIGQCLIRFPNIYRRWHGNETRNSYDLTNEWEALVQPRTRGLLVDQKVVDYEIAMNALSTVKNPRVRKAMLMTAGGFTQAEIAIELGVSEKAVERMLANERTRQRKRRAG